jgi:hypothetical protein
MSLWIRIMLLAVSAGLAAGLGQPRVNEQLRDGGDGSRPADRRTEDPPGSASPEVGT